MSGKRKPKQRKNNRRPQKGKQAPKRPKKSSRFSSVSVGREIGKTLGNAYMPGIGGTLGGLAGSGLGWAFKKVTGVGDYKISSNTLTASGSPVPSFGENCVRIRHKEYLGDVVGTTAYSNTPFPINPGLASSFPWLSTIASCYQEYYFAGLLFNFVSTSADALNSTNTALGKIIMATDYNASNPPFTTPTQMLATEFSNYGKPADNLMHAIECHPKLRPTLWQYVRTANIPYGKDPRLYDMGDFQLASQGMQASANIGGLWVTYDVILCKPVVASSGSLYDLWANYATTSTATLAPGTLSGSAMSIGVTVAGSSQNPILTFPKNFSSGTYLLQIELQGVTGSTTVQSPVAGLTNAVTSALYDPTNVASIVTQAPTGAGQNYIYRGYISITAPGATINLQPPITGPSVQGTLSIVLRYVGP